MSIKYTKIIFLMYFLSLFAVGCVSLLPPEKRIYPKNPITLPEGLGIEEWLDTKKKMYQERFWWRKLGEEEYKLSYYRKETTSQGSFISCRALVRKISPNKIELYNLVSLVNYADYTKGINLRTKGGDLGPMNEKDRIEILLPCIEEMLFDNEK